MRRIMTLALAAAAFAGAAGAAELKLKRVMLSSGGVGYFEYQAQVAGWETIDLPVRLDQVDDVLKSAIVFDDKGGSGVIELQGRDTLEDVFRTMPVGPEAFASPASLYEALKGEEVSVSEPIAATGRIVSVVPETMENERGATITRHRMSLMTSAGLVSVVIEDARGIKFTNEALDAKINEALTALAANRQREGRTLKVTARGEGDRTVTVGYVVGAPLWKTAYRLVVGGDGQTRMQGWAVLENASGVAWSEVELTLVSGNPVTFRQALYDRYYVDRPYVPVEVLGRVMPQADDGSVARAGADAAKRTEAEAAGSSDYPAPAPAPPPPAAMPAPMPAKPANETYAAQSQEAATAVTFTLPNAVSAGSGQSLSVPIIDRSIEAQPVAFYQPDTHPRHPLMAVELTNNGETGLPPGVVTLFDTRTGRTLYVGDAVMNTLPVGESRMLSFALDQKTLIQHESSQVATLTSAKIASGVVETQSLLRYTIKYKVQGPKAEARRVVLESPRQPGWELKAPDVSIVRVTDRMLRVPFDLQPGENREVEVIWERVQAETLAMVNLSVDRLIAFADDTRLSDEQRAAFKRVAELQQEVSRLQNELNLLNGQRDNIFEEQERIRENLGAVPEGSDLARRYLAELSTQEDQLAEINRKAAELTALLEAAKKALGDYVGTLTL